MSCSDLTNASEQLKSACACKNAADSFVQGMEEHIAQLAAHAIKVAEYNSSWMEYNDDLKNWEDRYNAEKVRLQEEEKIWNNCAVWDDASNGQKDSWCQNDTGFGDHVGGTGGGCFPGFGKGRCRRTQDQVQSALNSWMAIPAADATTVSLGFSTIVIPPTPGNQKPSPPSGGTNGTVAPCTTCSPPQVNILCCSQIINDIQAGKNVNVNAVQNCAQALVDDATTTTTPIPTTTTSPIPTTTATPIPTTTTTPIPTTTTSPIPTTTATPIPTTTTTPIPTTTTTHTMTTTPIPTTTTTSDTVTTRKTSLSTDTIIIITIVACIMALSLFLVIRR